MRENRIHALVIQRFRNINKYTSQPKLPVIFSNSPKGGQKSRRILSLYLLFEEELKRKLLYLIVQTEFEKICKD